MVDPERTKKPGKKSSFKLKTSTWVFIFIFAFILLASIIVGSLYNDDSVANDDYKFVEEKHVKEAEASSTPAPEGVADLATDEMYSSVINIITWLVPLTAIMFIVTAFFRRPRW